MNLTDLTEINELAEALRARCEKAGVDYMTLYMRPAQDLEIHLTGMGEELVRLGAQTDGDWRMTDQRALRPVRLGVFTGLLSLPLAECDVIPAVVVPRGGV